MELTLGVEKDNGFDYERRGEDSPHENTAEDYGRIDHERKTDGGGVRDCGSPFCPYLW